MADLNLSPCMAYDKKVVHLAGSVSFNSSGVVTANNVLGAVVARTGTGTYTCTLNNVWPELLNFNVSILKATAADLQPQIVSETVSTTKIITFKLLTGAVATDLAEAGKFLIDIVLKNSTILP